MFEPKLGYYSGHFRRQGDGRMVVDTYPIPVVEVKGYCDVEINLDCIIISTKLCRTDALIYSYDKFTRFEFEYGLDDYACGFFSSE